MPGCRFSPSAATFTFREMDEASHSTKLKTNPSSICWATTTGTEQPFLNADNTETSAPGPPVLLAMATMSYFPFFLDSIAGKAGGLCTAAADSGTVKRRGVDFKCRITLTLDNILSFAAYSPELSSAIFFLG